MGKAAQVDSDQGAPASVLADLPVRPASVVEAVAPEDLEGDVVAVDSVDPAEAVSVDGAAVVLVGIGPDVEGIRMLLVVRAHSSAIGAIGGGKGCMGWYRCPFAIPHWTPGHFL